MGKEMQGMDVYILLDRTGSMNTIWTEAVASVNTYVKELSRAGADDHITLAVFDAYQGLQFDILRDTVPIGEWKAFVVDEVSPRGSTPLLDSLVRIVAMAEKANSEKTAIVVMTDGHENASREVTKEAAKAALDRVVEKNWQINFLGADFDGFSQARGLGVDHGRTMNFERGRADHAMASTAEVHQMYRGSRAPADYSKRNRKDAGEDNVK